MNPQKRCRSMSAIVAAVAGAGVFGSVVTAAQAADKNWTSTAPTAWWSDGNNWWAPVVPGAGDKAIIVNRNSAPQTVYYANSNGGNFMLSGLTLNAESTGDLNFVMRADTPHTLRSSITSIGSTDWVTFRQEGGNHEDTTHRVRGRRSLRPGIPRCRQAVPRSAGADCTSRRDPCVTHCPS